MVFSKGHKPLGRALTGHITSNETKEKIRMKAIKRYTNGFKSSNLGFHHTEETKKKMSENHADVSGKNNPMFGKKPGYKNQWGENNPNWRSGIGIYKKEAWKFLPKKCNSCGITEVRILLVHHKDRNRKNNKIDNLEILCRNCHWLKHLEDPEFIKKVYHR